MLDQWLRVSLRNSLASNDVLERLPLADEMRLAVPDQHLRGQRPRVVFARYTKGVSFRAAFGQLLSVRRQTKGDQ